MAQITIEIKGLDAAMRKLDPALLRGPKYKLLRDATLRTQREAKIRAPIEFNRLRSSLQHRLDSGTTPSWARVFTPIPGYPEILDTSSRHHYLRDRFAGELTQRWFSDVPKLLIDQYKGFVQEFVRQVLALWSRTR